MALGNFSHTIDSSDSGENIPGETEEVKKRKHKKKKIAVRGAKFLLKKLMK